MKQIVELKQQNEQLISTETQLRSAYLACEKECTSLKATVERLEAEAQQATCREARLQFELEMKREAITSWIELNNEAKEDV